jgi:uncharacterized protein (DUF983 family)
MKKGSKVYSIVNMTCPRCHSGDLYPTTTFSFKKSFTMHENCPHCGQRYVLESGFYYGSMFVSYMITAFIMFSLFAICKFLLGFGIIESFALVTCVVFILFVWIFRVSRAVWINFFVKFDKKYV